MLKDELAKIDVSHDTPFVDSGIILYCPNNTFFYKITFGTGDNLDSVCDGCDYYMNISMDTYNFKGRFLENIDGGQLDIARKDYSGFINDEKLIRNCLKVFGCAKIDSCILIKKIR